jgi:hypothetical protein
MFSCESAFNLAAKVEKAASAAELAGCFSGEEGPYILKIRLRG